jgi:Polyketide cyclase / dehydrase and lipid transport
MVATRAESAVNACGTTDAPDMGMFPYVLAVLALFFIATTPVPAAADAPRGPSIHWSRDKKDPRWVNGYVLVDTAPDAVWAALQGVSSWPTMFSDIKTMKVKRHDGNAWRLEMSTRTFDCGAHDYEVLVQPDRTISVRMLVPGANAVAYVRVRPVQGTEQSIVTYDLFVDVRGVASWFISEKTLRQKQEAMTTRYLGDLQRAFTPVRPKA